MTARRLRSFVLVLGATIAPFPFAACSSSSTPAFTGDDSGAGGSSSSSSSSGSGSGSSSGASSGSSSGSASDGGSSSSSGGGRVPTNVIRDDAGVPLCGSTPCDLSTNECCISIAGVGTCHPQGTACPTQGVFKCIEKADCPGNQVCCGTADSTAMTAGSGCQDVSTTGGKCTPATTSTTGSAQLCQTNAECKSGSCIWQDCAVGATLKPSLTMCGLQSSAPFNCTAH